MNAHDQRSTKAAELPPAFTLADLANHPIEPRIWAWEGLIPAGTLTLLSGEGGIGKTHLLLQLAISTAIGATLFGRKTRPGPVVLVTAEDPRTEIHRRVASIASAWGIDLADLAVVHVIPLIEHASALLAERKGIGSIEWLPLAGQIEALVSTINPVLIAFDPASELFGGDENNRAEVAAFAGRLRRLAYRTGAAVVLSIHPSVAGLSENSGRSGSVAWANSCRSRLFLKTAKDGDGLELHVTKTNVGRPGKAFALGWRDGVIDVASDEPPEIVGAKSNALDEKVLRIFDRIAGIGIEMTLGTSRSSAAVRISGDPDARGIKTKTIAEIVDRLCVNGQLQVRTTGPPSKPKQVVFRPAEP